MNSRVVTCPRCQVPFIRHGLAAQSSRFYVPDPDVCIVCRENLDPVTLAPRRYVARPHPQQPIEEADFI